jgi:hypothetical protein
LEREKTEGGKEAGKIRSRCPRAGIAIRDDLKQLVQGKCTSFGSAGKGYYSRVPLLVEGGVLHLINCHPPTYDKGAGAFDSWLESVQADFRTHISAEDLVIAGGDFNFSPIGAAEQECHLPRSKKPKVCATSVRWAFVDEG